MGGYHSGGALALLLAVGAPAAVARDASSAGQARPLPAFETVILATHNHAREALRLPSLAWDATLAEHARAYARRLADGHRLVHSAQRTGAAEGENLWAGTRGGYGYDEMVGGWLAEQAAGPARALHYSQVVWRATTRVGCAVASDDRSDYLVCRYSPAGNILETHAF